MGSREKCATANSVHSFSNAVMKSLTDFLELIQKVKTPAPWIFAIFCIVYLDWYALQNVGLSFSELLSDPASAQNWAGEQWLLRLTVCIAIFSFFWFVGLSLMIMPFLDWVIFECQFRLPRLLQNAPKHPSQEKGYVYLPTARQYAIFHQNKLLLEYCDTKFQRLQDIAILRRCCIGIALFGVMAWTASISSHPSLLDHLCLWFDQTTTWKKFVFSITAMMMAAYILPILFRTNDPFDNYIYLPKLADELKR